MNIKKQIKSIKDIDELKSNFPHIKTIYASGDHYIKIINIISAPVNQWDYYNEIYEICGITIKKNNKLQNYNIIIE